MKMAQNIQKFFERHNLFDIIALVLVLIVLLLSVYMNDTFVATVSAVFGLLYTIWAGKGKVVCYIFGIISTLCYSWLSLKNALWGGLLLHIGYYFPMEIAGIFNWQKNLNKKTNTIKKTSLTNKERTTLCIVLPLMSFLLFFLLKLAKGNYPIMDAVTTVFSVAGMYLTVKRCIEQWFIWTVVNFISVVMWFVIFANGGRNFATLIMWLIYLFLGIYFFVEWDKDIKNCNN